MATLSTQSSMESCPLPTLERAQAPEARQEAIRAAALSLELRSSSAEEAARKAAALTVAEPIPDEIEIQSEWGQLLDASHPPLTSRQFDEHEIWLVENLFSTDECSVLMEKSEMYGYGKTHYPKAYRGNLRLLTTDSSLAEAIWHRLKPLVPSTVSCDGAVWDAVGLNECWRLAKYHPLDRFQGHCDASFSRSRQEQSMFTVNVYMNEGFEGGRTRFYLANPSLRKADLAVVPKTGLCLLFRQPPGQSYYHDGEQLQSGLKYLFRSDVMYRKRTPLRDAQ